MKDGEFPLDTDSNLRKQVKLEKSQETAELKLSGMKARFRCSSNINPYQAKHLVFNSFYQAVTSNRLNQSFKPLAKSLAIFSLAEECSASRTGEKKDTKAKPGHTAKPEN